MLDEKELRKMDIDRLRMMLSGIYTGEDYKLLLKVYMDRKEETYEVVDWDKVSDMTSKELGYYIYRCPKKKLKFEDKRRLIDKYVDLRKKEGRK